MGIKIRKPNLWVTRDAFHLKRKWKKPKKISRKKGGDKLKSTIDKKPKIKTASYAKEIKVL